MRFWPLLAASAALVLACQAQAQQIIQVEKLGDDELTCQELYNEVKTLDGIIAGTPSPATAAANAQAQAQAQAATAANAQLQAQNAQIAAHAAQQAAIHAGSSSGFALGGLFGSIASAVASNQAAKAAQAPATPAAIGSGPAQIEASGKRKTHLTALFKQQKCKVKNLVQ